MPDKYVVLAMGSIAASMRAEQYRRMARRVLADAQGTRDPAAKSALLEIASQCAWLAEWSESHDRAAEG